MVLFAKVVLSTLALLPFFVFIEKRLGQHCVSGSKSPVVSNDIEANDVRVVSLCGILQWFSELCDSHIHFYLVQN